MKFLLKSIVVGISVAVLFFIVVALFAEAIKFLDQLGIPYVLGFLFLVVAGVAGSIHYSMYKGRN